MTGAITFADLVAELLAEIERRGEENRRLRARVSVAEAERDDLLVEECSLEDCGAQRIEDEAFTCTNCYAAAAQGRERAETRLAELEAERDEWRSVVEVPAYFGDPQAARGYVRGLISHHAEHHEREEKAAARLAESQARGMRLAGALWDLEQCVSYSDTLGQFVLRISAARPALQAAREALADPDGPISVLEAIRRVPHLERSRCESVQSWAFDAGTLGNHEPETCARLGGACALNRIFGGR